jgi:hypothetical protein
MSDMNVRALNNDRFSPDFINFEVEWYGSHDRFLGDIELEDHDPNYAAMQSRGYYLRQGCFVYVMCLSTTPFTKVGIAKDVEKRQQDLAQPLMPSIRAIWWFETRKEAAAVERKAHAILARLRFHREWFSCSEAGAILAVRMAMAEVEKQP